MEYSKMTFKQLGKQMDEEQNNTFTCKCGHRLLILNKFVICNWCGRKVYRSEKDKFKDVLGRRLKIGRGL